MSLVISLETKSTGTSTQTEEFTLASAMSAIKLMQKRKNIKANEQAPKTESEERSHLVSPLLALLQI